MKNEREFKKLKDAAGHMLPAGGFIAGGALTSVFSNKPISDIDIYFKSKEAFEDAIFDAYDDGLWAHAASDRSITFVDNGRVVQFIYFEFFETAEAVFDAFDFTCCMAAWDIDAKDWVFHPDFMKHVAQRYLSFHPGTRFPFASLLRVAKYQQRGYSIGRGDLLQIALRCHQVPLTSWEDFAHAVGGQYGEEVIDLQDKGEFTVDAAIKLLQRESIIRDYVPRAMPGNPGDMLEYLELLKKQPFVKYTGKYFL